MGLKNVWNKIKIYSILDVVKHGSPKSNQLYYERT